MTAGVRIGFGRTWRRSAHASSRPRLALLAVTALAVWALKRHYASASVDDLCWILNPVAALADLATGAHFEWEPGWGHLSRDRLFVIAKPCAGINFMLAALAMLGFLLSEDARSWRGAAFRAALTGIAAYAAAILANTFRIVAALWMAAHPLGGAWWTAPRVHRLEGIAVYFGVLALLHVVVRRALASSPKAAPR